MTKQIKVCQALHGIVGGGSEQVVLNYCSRMSDIHFDLLYQYEPNPQILERFKETGFNCIQIPDKVHHPIKHLWAIFRILKNGHYDVVHSHLDWYLNAYVMFLAWLAGVPKRIAHHHQAYHLTNPLMKLLCAMLRIPNKVFSTHWLACGKAAAENGWGKRTVANGKVTILPNAIDPERFKFDEVARKRIREQYGIAEDDFVMGHVGRFFSQKNHTFLVDIFAELCKGHPNSKLLMLGDGPLQKEIRQKVESLGLSNKVVFVGLQKDPAPFYSAMDVFCFPSLWEGLGIVLVEAQCSGLPCISSLAVPDEAKVSENFYQIGCECIGEWAKKINDIFERRGKRNSIIPLEYDIRELYGRLENIYLNF